MTAPDEALPPIPIPPPRTGALQLPPGLNVGEAFARILGHHGALMLRHAARIPADADDPEPVHQTRVALRRLRSAIAVFRAATGTPAIATLGQDLRALGHLLAPARAWDVFLAETGHRIAEVFPDDTTIQTLLSAAARKRDRAYATLLRDRAGPHFAALTAHLTSIVDHGGWRAGLLPEQRALLTMPLNEYGAGALDRLHNRVRRGGKRIMHLDPPALHALRLRAKRLRYAAEFFTEQFEIKPARRYIARLADLQAQLGLLNDAVTTAILMTELRARGHAAGVVMGYTAAHAEAARQHLAEVWKQFRKAEPFWPDLPIVAAEEAGEIVPT